MLLLIALFLQTLYADNIYDYYQDRSASQWTLSDWLATKKKASLMDQWLSSNRSSKKVFDFQLGYAKRNSQESLNHAPASDIDYEGLNLGVYFYFFGIEGDYFRNQDNHTSKNWSYSINLRLLGSSQQSTHWKVYYGLLHEQDSTSEFENPFVGSSFNLYVTSYFGLQGDYRKYLSEKNDLLTKKEGQRSHYGVFLEIFFFRLYHHWQQEDFDLVDISNTKSTLERKNREFGIMIFY